MSVDLKMLVLDGYSSESNFAFAHTMLEVGACYEYHDRVRRLPSEPIPKDFSSYVATDAAGEQCYGQVTEDCYGAPLRMVRAEDLAKIKYRTEFWRLIATVAYIKALPPATWVALYWH